MKTPNSSHKLVGSKIHRLHAPRFLSVAAVAVPTDVLPTFLRPRCRRNGGPLATPLETSSRLCSHNASPLKFWPQHAAVIPRHVSAAHMDFKRLARAAAWVPKIARLELPDEVEVVQHVVNDRSVRGLGELVELLPQSNVRECPQGWRPGRCSITEHVTPQV